MESITPLEGDIEGLQDARDVLRNRQKAPICTV